MLHQTTFSDDVLVSEKSILEAKEWEDRIVGFFLDKKLPYTLVKENVKKRLKLLGDVDIALDGDIYYFKFNIDKEDVLDVGSFYNAGKLCHAMDERSRRESGLNPKYTYMG
ncbi:hypothetical protein IFM89_000327 [Coptis chinensis]|uniref:Uncharacterized protein n=1 Tax=Coptis chinensis TaxID=261450 RepID=A0A835H9V3_9MAGN|nr:hypothetical protein IFM89_000327 [Coptis chinensis]